MNELIIFEGESEYVLEHDLPMEKIFYNPKIYTANSDYFDEEYAHGSLGVVELYCDIFLVNSIGCKLFYS